MQILQQRDALFVLLASGTTYSTTDLLPAPSARSLTVVPGISFVTFNGPDGTDVGALLAQSASLMRAFHFAAGNWQGFLAGDPVFLNKFSTLNHLDAFFIFNASRQDVVTELAEVTN